MERTTINRWILGGIDERGEKRGRRTTSIVLIGFVIMRGGGSGCWSDDVDATLFKCDDGGLLEAA